MHPEPTFTPRCRLLRIIRRGCACQQSAPPPPPAAERYLSAKEAAAYLKISTRTVWRWLSAGQFPEPVRLQNRLVRWRLSDLERLARERQ